MTKRPKLEESDDFRRFWAAYPKRRPNPRYEALRAWDALLRSGEDAEALIGAAGRFAAEILAQAPDPKFIPHARTWLAQRRFEDYTAEPSPDARIVPIQGVVDDRLNRVMTPAEQRNWLAGLRIKGNTAVVTVVSRFAATEVPRRWGEAIQRALGVEDLRFEVRR